MLLEVAAMDGATPLSKTAWTYDEEGRVDTETRHSFSANPSDTWTLDLDWLGNQEDVIDDDSKTTTSKHDDMGRMVRLISPDQSGDTLRLFDEAGRLTTVKEVLGGGANERTHSFTFDNIGRPLTSDYSGTCQTFNIADIVRVYDSLTGAPSCPGGTSCTNLGGRLAYVKVKLMCTTAAGPDGDYTLEQETWYGYDAAGRRTHEYISDENGRTAGHVYAWTKNGALETTTLPSGTVFGSTFGSAGSNSDKDRPVALWRTSTGTPIIDNILYESFGPFRQYNQMNTLSSTALRTKVSRNLAYRVTETKMETQTGGTTAHSVTITEDNKGRVTARDYSSHPGVVDSYFRYDGQDRVLCETPSAGACPSSYGGEKNNHYDAVGAGNFTGAGDWKNLWRPIPGSTGWVHAFTLNAGTHQIYEVNQSNGTPTLGVTRFTHDARGNRTSDDNISGLLYDGRTYSYDSRRNVVNVAGKYYSTPSLPGGQAWWDYNVGSAFDAQNRRVYKSVYRQKTNITSTYFFYYDALNRLSEIRYTANTAAPTTFIVYQLIWLGDQLVGYWQTDYPSATTWKRYVGRDESGRPVVMWMWPSSGDGYVDWAINPDAWGNDGLLSGFQPIVFAGQYRDAETAAQWTSSTRHRPALVLNGFRTYDPWTGTYLQLDPLVQVTWNSYLYVNNDPVNKRDSKGLAWDGGSNTAPEYVVIEDTVDRNCWDLHLCFPGGEPNPYPLPPQLPNFPGGLGPGGEETDIDEYQCGKCEHFCKMHIKKCHKIKCIGTSCKQKEKEECWWAKRAHDQGIKDDNFYACTEERCLQPGQPCYSPHL